MTSINQTKIYSKISWNLTCECSQGHRDYGRIFLPVKQDIGFSSWFDLEKFIVNMPQSLLKEVILEYNTTISVVKQSSLSYEKPKTNAICKHNLKKLSFVFINSTIRDSIKFAHFKSCNVCVFSIILTLRCPCVSEYH